jgi:flagellar hook assembly protein FlgD
VPEGTTLSQNYPNPFNPVTTIAFTVREPTPVTLRVYNAAGQLVRTLVDGTRAPGVVHAVEWDGRSDRGSRVASGVYFYRLKTRETTRTRKMVLLK